MNRQMLPLLLALAIAPLSFGQTSANGAAYGTSTVRTGAADFPNTMTFMLAGDSIINRRLSVYTAPGFPEMIARIRRADAAFTNLETLIHNFDTPGTALGGGTYMGSPPWILDELKWAGFSLVSIANNHAGDYGIEGVRSTQRALQAARMTYAGIGENLARARAPSYLDTSKGRVALIACTSSFPGSALAGVQRPDMPGRPGLSPLRFNTTYVLDSASFKSLQQVAELAPSTGEGAATAGFNAKSFRFLGNRFEEGSARAVHTTPRASDLAEILASIREARQQAEWVVVSAHTHESGEGNNKDIPAEFYVTFAHAAIEAGADIVVTHGPHRNRGLEVYRSKPIFYGVGDFIDENEQLPFLPSENYESVGLPLTAQPSEFFEARTANGSWTMVTDEQVWMGMLAETAFDMERNLQSIKLYPTVLGYKKPRPQRGRAAPAPEPQGKVIIERVARLSQAYGITISYDQGVGTVSWKK